MHTQKQEVYQSGPYIEHVQCIFHSLENTYFHSAFLHFRKAHVRSVMCLYQWLKLQAYPSRIFKIHCSNKQSTIMKYFSS